VVDQVRLERLAGAGGLAELGRESLLVVVEADAVLMVASVRRSLKYRAASAALW
jgi:hypothetical protein